VGIDVVDIRDIDIQTWALALYFQVCSPLIFYPWIAFPHFADFQVRSLLNRSKKTSG